MRMGRRRQSGGGGGGGGADGGKSPSIFKKKLLRHVNSCQINHPTIDQLVDYLRSTYSDYSRLKLRVLARNVSDVLEESGGSKRLNNCSVSNDSDIDSSGYGSSSQLRNQGKKLNTSEERLKRKQVGEERNGLTSSSLDDDEEEEEEEDGSSSEDAIYGEEYEPKFDLMKSQLQQSYLMKSKEKSLKDDDIVEMEVVNDTTSKGKQKVGLVRDGSQKVAAKLDFERKGRSEENNGKGSGPRFEDLGGMDKVVEELKMEVLLPLCHPEVPESIGVKPISGILFHGPPGCGKTKLAHAIANETGIPFYKISATEVVSGISGASEENIRNLFSKAYRTAPSIVFIDEIDAIASKREKSQREMERRIVTQLMTCMDELHRVGKSADGNADLEMSDGKPGYVLVIGATNRPNDLDDALRRPGRFDREIALDIPDESARVGILSVLARNLKVEGSFNLLKVARATPGFVGADLAALANKAGNLAMKRIIDQRRIKFSREDPDGELAEDWWRRPWLPEEVDILSITMADFEEAVKMVQPSSKREGFSAIPNETWDDVGGLHQLKEVFERYIIRRIKYPEDYEDFGVHLESGFLLYGPPGCGKTLIAKAVANAAGANFISIGGPQILNKYVGESELEVRKIFARARTCAPCIIFFDEVDSLATKRGREGGWVVERLLNQLLTELDGADQRKGVYVIGATNRPEIMDEALLRPGRFGKLVYVPLPNPDERGLILRALAKKNNRMDPSVDLMEIGRDCACENFSGADLSLLMHDAAHAALDEKQRLRESGSDVTTYTIKEVHFRQALENISPSVSKKQLRYYKRLPKILRRS